MRRRKLLTPSLLGSGCPCYRDAGCLYGQREPASSERSSRWR